MSGGHFEYQQYRVDEMAEEVERLIRYNEIPDEWGYVRNYSDETIKRFREGARYLRLAAIYAQRIDWLVSADDSEATFHERLAEELEAAE